MRVEHLSEKRPSAADQAKCMGRSNAEPSLRMSAGARFTVTAGFEGKSNPQFLSADLIRSRLSFTAISGRPATFKISLLAWPDVHLNFHEIGINAKHCRAECFEEPSNEKGVPFALLQRNSKEYVTLVILR
jgi:hypothetical protein